MKVKIAGLEMEVKTTEDIQASGCIIMAVPVSKAGPLEMYAEGTRAGFTCALCGCDCILAPSGQQIVAAGKNPIHCMDCTLATLTKDSN